MRVHYLWFVALIFLALNAVASTFSMGEYLVQFGGFRFPAQTPYKPLLLLSGAAVVYFLMSKQGTDTKVEEHGRLAVPFILLLACVVGFVYSPAIAVNFSHQDWTHRHMGARLNSWSAVWRLFVEPQPDGMYRPLAFLSFALDYQLFGPTLWGYHLQSIGLHVLNSILAGMLAIRLGFGVWTGRVAALLFGVSACHFEAVLWPAARFDLLATAFGAISLLLFMDHWETIGARSWWFGGLGLLSYVIAVLNKETAYSIVLIVPLLIAFLKHGVDERRRARAIIPALLGCTVALVAVRFGPDFYRSIDGNIHFAAACNGNARMAVPSQCVASCRFILRGQGTFRYDNFHVIRLARVFTGSLAPQPTFHDSVPRLLASPSAPCRSTD